MIRWSFHQNLGSRKTHFKMGHMVWAQITLRCFSELMLKTKLLEGQKFPHFIHHVTTRCLLCGLRFSELFQQSFNPRFSEEDFNRAQGFNESQGPSRLDPFLRPLGHIVPGLCCCNNTQDLSGLRKVEEAPKWRILWSNQHMSRPATTSVLTLSTFWGNWLWETSTRLVTPHPLVHQLQVFVAKKHWSHPVKEGPSAGRVYPRRPSAVIIKPLGDWREPKEQSYLCRCVSRHAWLPIYLHFTKIHIHGTHKCAYQQKSIQKSSILCLATLSVLGYSILKKP